MVRKRGKGNGGKGNRTEERGGRGIRANCAFCCYGGFSLNFLFAVNSASHI